MPSSSAAPRRDDETATSRADVALWDERNIGPALKLGRGRIRVRVAGALLVLAAVPGIAGGAPRMAFCAAVVLSALLAHESGHALCGLLWGRQVTVLLHVLGARTAIEPKLPRGLELLSIAAGPLLSLAVGLLAAWLQSRLPAEHWLSTVLLVNLAWGAINLLPVLPFDGGRALLVVLGERRRATALLISGSLSLIVAMAGLIALRNAPLFFLFSVAALASLFSWFNQRRLEQEQALSLPEQLNEARQLLSIGEAERARQLATRVAVRALRNVTGNAAWETVAWAELELGRAVQAQVTLSRIRPAASISQHCLAAVSAARGLEREAIALLEATRGSEASSAEAVKLLIDLYVGQGSFEKACGVAGAELLLLNPDDTRRVVQAAFAAGAAAPATRLAEQLFALTGNPDDAASQAQARAGLGRKAGRPEPLVRLLSGLVPGLLWRVPAEEAEWHRPAGRDT